MEPLLVSPGEDTDPEISRDGNSKLISHSRPPYFCPDSSGSCLQDRPGNSGKRGKSWLVLCSRRMKRELLSFPTKVTAMSISTQSVPDGTDLRQLTWAKGERNTFPRWSADGAFLYFNQSRPEPSLRKLLLSGGPSSALVSGWTWETHRYAHIDSSNGSIICTRMDDNRPVSTIIREIESGREVSLGRCS